ncbi:hypothetical protein [Rhodoferax sp. PAMC 29310]|jgi:hypothetical protein|uniref:hypothetical protein n=1 Tax=Rhodoferax sp. PAMC 29310 TaxID=2822760 RepID=UPI001B3424F7|nr:hypothetical protein [Rhodoferax sp. PAMC 29310]
MKSSRRSSSSLTPAPAALTFYEVAEYGTITYPGVTEPKTRADVFESISPRAIHSTEDLISQVEGCSPLACYFSGLAASHLEDIEAELDDDDCALGLIKRRRLVFLAAALRHDPDTGWCDWVEHEGDPGLASFKEHIQDWLDEDIDWGESDWFDDCWSGQSAALGMFSNLDGNILKALGVVIVEGEHPGSSYYAAELRDDIAQANLKAQELGLDFRFRAEGEDAPDVQLLNPDASRQGGAS